MRWFAWGCCARFSSFLLPSQPQLQSMAASFHGSANIRCVSSPSGGLIIHTSISFLCCSSRISWQIKHVLFHLLWFLLNSIRLLTIGSRLRGVRKEKKKRERNKKKKNTRTPALKSLPAGACHRPPPPVRPFCCECASAFLRFCLMHFKAYMVDTYCKVQTRFFLFHKSSLLDAI